MFHDYSWFYHSLSSHDLWIAHAVIHQGGDRYPGSRFLDHFLRYQETADAFDGLYSTWLCTLPIAYVNVRTPTHILIHFAEKCEKSSPVVYMSIFDFLLLTSLDMTCSSKFVSSYYIHKLILLINICHDFIPFLCDLFKGRRQKRSSRRENHRTTPRQRCCSCWVKLVAWTSTTSLRPDLRFKGWPKHTSRHCRYL